MPKLKDIFSHQCSSLGKIPLNVEELKVDLMSLSGHKIYGPIGVGALYMCRRPRVRVEPQMSGGRQKRGIQSGTVPTPFALGMGAACAIAMQDMIYDAKYIDKLTKRLLNGLFSKLEGIVVNDSMEHRCVGNLNVSFSYAEGESLLLGLKEVAISSIFHSHKTLLRRNILLTILWY